MVLSDPKLTQHRYGCGVIKHTFLHAPARYRDIVFTKVMSDIIFLMDHLFANYVVQCILENGSHTEVNMIVQASLTHMNELISNKCSSNVVETMITCADDEICTKIVKEITSIPNYQSILHNQVSE